MHNRGHSALLSYAFFATVPVAQQAQMLEVQGEPLGPTRDMLSYYLGCIEPGALSLLCCIPCTRSKQFPVGTFYVVYNCIVPLTAAS